LFIGLIKSHSFKGDQQAAADCPHEAYVWGRQLKHGLRHQDIVDFDERASGVSCLGADGVDGPALTHVNELIDGRWINGYFWPPGPHPFDRTFVLTYPPALN
jgi:hypothetical protein